MIGFPAGYYVYTGSAMGGVEARVSRHLRRRKRLRWHVDYLLRAAEVVGVVSMATTRRVECACNRAVLRMRGAKVVAPGFGASDCRCPAHLVHFVAKPRIAKAFWPGRITRRPGDARRLRAPGAFPASFGE